MIDFILIFDLMKDAERIWRGDSKINKKEMVISSIIKIVGRDAYNEEKIYIDALIEFVIFLSQNRDLLKNINRSFCCLK